jgi:nucleoside-diphosphate-sugar epimerase
MELTQRAFIDHQLGAVGIVARYRHIPAVVARAAAAVVEAAAPLVGAPLPLIRLVTGMAACDFTHNTARARQELGFEPRVSLDEGLARLKAWATALGGAQALALLGTPPAEEEAT